MYTTEEEKLLKTEFDLKVKCFQTLIYEEENKIEFLIVVNKRIT
jgi:hypothetical protein